MMRIAWTTVTDNDRTRSGGPEHRACNRATSGRRRQSRQLVMSRDHGCADEVPLSEFAGNKPKAAEASAHGGAADPNEKGPRPRGPFFGSRGAAFG
jgi:hypothetical protein